VRKKVVCQDKIRPKKITFRSETGGASGIGLGITRSFAAQGAHVSVLDVNAEGTAVVQTLAAEFADASFSFHQVDISKWDELAAAFERIHQDQGRIDAVMANAGISREQPLIVEEEKPSKPTLPTLEINLIGTIYSAFQHLVERHSLLMVSRQTGDSLHSPKCGHSIQRLHHLYGLERRPVPVPHRAHLRGLQVWRRGTGEVAGATVAKGAYSDQRLGAGRVGFVFRNRI
jgi:hypothetical protein